MKSEMKLDLLQLLEKMEIELLFFEKCREHILNHTLNEVIRKTYKLSSNRIDTETLLILRSNERFLYMINVEKKTLRAFLDGKEIGKNNIHSWLSVSPLLGRFIYFLKKHKIRFPLLFYIYDEKMSSYTSFNLAVLQWLYSVPEVKVRKMEWRYRADVGEAKLYFTFWKRNRPPFSFYLIILPNGEKIEYKKGGRIIINNKEVKLSPILLYYYISFILFNSI